MAAIFLTACGGGGGGGGGGGNDAPSPSPLTLNLSSSNAINFSAIYPLAPTPPAQTISANVTGEGSGILYVLVDFDGQAIKSISDVSLSGNTGQATVTPALPNDLGSGTFMSTIRIRACINDSTCATGQIAGSPKTIAVNYTVGAITPPDSAMPHVLTAGRTGSFILRGSGLSNVTSVQIGGVQATSITTISDTELHASYPMLTTGNKPIMLNGGSILFNGSVVAVPAPSLPIANMAFPQTPARIGSLV